MAQQTAYFNNIHDYSGWDELWADLSSTALEIPGRGYFVVGVSWDAFADLEKRWIMRLDKWGEILWVREYGFTDTLYRHFYFGGDMHWTSDSNILIMEITYNKSLLDSMQCRLVMLDTACNIIWQKPFRYNNDATVGIQIISTTDGGYAVAGSNFDSLDIFLIKLDSLGNKEWQKAYGGPSLEEAFSLVQTADGGYFVLGYTESFGAGDADMYLIKTDSAGNLEWDTTYGNFSTDWGAYIIPTLDSNYLLVGGKSLNAAYESRQAWMIKIDQTGSVIWNKEFGGGHRDGFYKALQLEDSSYIVIGHTRSYNVDANIAGWIMKLNSHGDSLWARVYDNTYRNDYFYDFTLTQDKGFLICGSSWNTDTSVNNTNANDAWIIKLDSMGLCDSSYCYPDDTTGYPDDTTGYPDDTIGIEQILPAQSSVEIYPNPFDYSTTISVKFASDNYDKELSLVIYDILGKGVYQIKSFYEEIVFFKNELSEGMYFYRISNKDGIIGTGKVIIE